MYKCPKCGSSNTIKEKIMGADTMDRICQNCKYIGSKNEFKNKEQKKD
jgi:RNA polymerase subunit RPABC4/transcription elongation factor Spt4